MSLVNEFLKNIRKKHEPEEMKISQWTGTSRRSNHLLKIEFEPNPVIIYVKESNSASGFWGLTKNQIDRLNNSTLPWFCVLLLRSSISGYILNSNEVNNKINDQSFELSSDGDYKVNEKLDLSANMNFPDIEVLMNIIKSAI
jgi:hypothetical protein